MVVAYTMLNLLKTVYLSYSFYPFLSYFSFFNTLLHREAKRAGFDDVSQLGPLPATLSELHCLQHLHYFYSVGNAGGNGGSGSEGVNGECPYIVAPVGVVTVSATTINSNPALRATLSETVSLKNKENGPLIAQLAGDAQVKHVPVGGALSSNSGELVRDWCLAGHGIMLRSLWDIEDALQTGQLVRVLPDWSQQDADIHWLAPWRAVVPRRIALLQAHLAQSLGTEPWRQKPLKR